MVESKTHKYTIAWFKLAEFVTRREKEKALGIFRLLAHSLPDKGVAMQLEGDIFLSFADNLNAVNSYLKAIEHYKSENKYIPTVAIYEHIISLRPETYDEHKFKMLKIYIKLKNKNKINIMIKNLVDSKKIFEWTETTGKLNLEKLYNFIQDAELTYEDRFTVYSSLINIKAEKANNNEFSLKLSFEPFYLMLNNDINNFYNLNSHELDIFLKKLEFENINLYEYCINQL